MEILVRGNFNISITINPPAMISTGIQIAGQGPNVGVNFDDAADAGELVGAITVSTNTGADYQGVITMSGADAGKFALDNGGNYPCNLKVGNADVPAGSYAVSLTATP
jgi:hypothetical protein